MSGRWVRRGFLVAGVVAILAVAGSVALAAVPTKGGAVYACYNKSTGAMRVVNYPNKHCTSRERMVSLASGSVAPRHVAATFVGSVGDPAWITAMYRIEIDATPTGALRDGYYESNNLTGPEEFAGTRTQATVDTLRFFTASSGAPAAEFTGWECLVSKGPASTGELGTCGHYRIIVTDGASKGVPDTFCGGDADVTDPADPSYCPYVWNVDKGNIRIYSGY